MQGGNPQVVAGMLNTMLSPDPSVLAWAMAQRKEKADALQGGAVSAVVVTVRVDAARTACFGIKPKNATRTMEMTMIGVQRCNRNMSVSPFVDVSISKKSL